MEFIPTGNGYAIRCIRTPRRHVGQAVYMSVEGEVREKALVVGTIHRTEWIVERTNEGLRISWPNSDLVLELGNGSSGPQLMLQTLVLGELRQLWRFVRCSQPEPEPQPTWTPQFPKTIEAEPPRSTTTEPGKDGEVVVESARSVGPRDDGGGHRERVDRLHHDNTHDDHDRHYDRHGGDTHAKGAAAALSCRSLVAPGARRPFCNPRTL